MGGNQTKVHTIQKEGVSVLFQDRFNVQRELAKYDLKGCFENLAFEGGGSKGTAYVGALMVLEELDILPGIRRMAGSSAGAMLASLVAVGYSPDEILSFLYSNTKTILMDSTCGYCSLLPSLFRHYGWIPGRRLENWFKMILAAGPRNTLTRKDKGDITFIELYKITGIELCITATNVNYMSIDYFHPKTTPNVPIRKAIRMSMALPGIYRSVPMEHVLYLGGNCTTKVKDLYVDGGLLCNYPVYVFDGWWLSLKPENQFLRRMRPLENIHKFYDHKERFGEVNDKTLGLMLYSAHETEVGKNMLDTRENSGPAPRPDTKLVRQRLKDMNEKKESVKRYNCTIELIDKFLNCLEAIKPMDMTVEYDIATVRDVLSTKFSDQDLLALFPKYEGKLDHIISGLDLNNDGKLSLPEIISFVEKHGIDLQKGFLGYGRQEVNGLGQFIRSLQAEDVHRTIGINTDYIQTTDWKLEFEDKRFLINCGINAALAFLQEYVEKNAGNLPLRKSQYLSSRECTVLGSSRSPSPTSSPCKNY